MLFKNYQQPSVLLSYMNKQQKTSVDTRRESKNSWKGKDRSPLLSSDRYIFPIIMDIFIQEQYTSSDCYVLKLHLD